MCYKHHEKNQARVVCQTKASIQAVQTGLETGVASFIRYGDKLNLEDDGRVYIYKVKMMYKYQPAYR